MHAMLLLRRSHSTQRLLPRSIIIKGSRTTVLNSPNDYLSSILNLICKSQHDITLSALYFGNGEPERQIIAAIKGALSDEKRPNLTCTYILDFSRTTRIPAKGQEECSLQMFKPLLEMFGNRMKVLLYRMPQHFGIFNSLVPGQLSEILGVYHCKFCLFDENVILTGANLSTEYLTNRQDRYMLIEQATSSYRGKDSSAGSSDLPHFLKSFVKILEPHCCRAMYIAADNTDSKVQGVTIAEPLTHAISSLSILESELKNLLQIQSTGDMVDRQRSSVTSLRPLVQHSKCGLLDESHHLLDLLFPSMADSLSYSSLGPEHRPEHRRTDQKQESSTILPIPSMLEMSRAEENRMHQGRIVIASPYPSFLPLFTSSLLSLSTPRRILGQSSDTHQQPKSRVLGTEEDCERRTGSEGESGGAESTKMMQKNREKNILSENCSDTSHNERDNQRVIHSENISNKTVSNTQNSSDSNNAGETSLKIIVSEERSHGFHKGEGLKNLIPKLHTYALQSVLLRCLKKSDLDRIGGGTVPVSTEPCDLYGNVSVCQYYRKDWTFHVKGIWLFSSSELAVPLMTSVVNTSNCASVNESANGTGFNQVYSPHTATYIGSSNFGERSLSRDFELGFVLHTTCPSLSSQLSEECSRLEEHSSEQSNGLREFTGRAKEAKWYIPVLTRFLRTFL